MVEHDFEEKDADDRGGERETGDQNVRRLDLGLGPGELVVDELLVIEHLAVRLRAQGHGADSLGDRR